MQNQQNIFDHFNFSRAFCRIPFAFSRSKRFLQIVCRFIACIYSLFCCISCFWRRSHLLRGSDRCNRVWPVICITLSLCNTYNSLQSMPSPAFLAAAKENPPVSSGFPSIFLVFPLQFSSTDTIFLATFSSNFRKLFARIYAY